VLNRLPSVASRIFMQRSLKVDSKS